MANRCTSQYYAADFVTVRTAPFDALYSMCIIFCPTMPPMGDMFTMEPPPSAVSRSLCLKISRAANLLSCNSETKFLSAVGTSYSVKCNSILLLLSPVLWTEMAMVGRIADSTIAE